MKTIATSHWSKLRRFYLGSPAEHYKVAIDASFQVTKLAGLLGLSPRQLERKFERHFHQSPKRWLHQKRMELALVYLKQAKSIQQTAAELGFKNPAHFSRAFKQYYGRAPSTIEGDLLPAKLFETGHPH